MRIAVTGASGYIGGWLRREFAACGHEVHPQDAVPARDQVFPVFDLADTGERRRWLDKAKPEVVIHLAALYGRVWGEWDLIRTAEANAGMAAEVARDTAAAGARLMFVSSSEVYGQSAAAGPVTEDSPLQPLNMYGLSKKWGEEASACYAPGGLMITRLNMPYGPPAVRPCRGEVPHISGRAGSTGYNVLHTMCWQAWHSMDIAVHRGTERCLTWVGDTVRGIAMIAGSGQAGTWNVNRDDDHIAMSALAKRVTALVPRCRSQITETDPPDQVTLRKPLRNTRLLALGWAPEMSLDEGMKQTLAYYSRFARDGSWRG